jgi:alkylation response protein AidB-like acyl-CoA dehydrogenase
MHQAGIEVRPLRQMTGSSEFNEVFFDGARTAKENVLGPVGDGWKVAMATLGFERGTAFLSQQLAFEHELAHLLDVARKNGAAEDAVVRDELARSYAGLQVMKYNGLRMLTGLVHHGSLGPELFTRELGRVDAVVKGVRNACWTLSSVLRGSLVCPVRTRCFHIEAPPWSV